MKKKAESSAQLYKRLAPVESATVVWGFTNRVVSKLNAGFSLLLKRNVTLEAYYPVQERVKLAVFYQYMRLRYKMPYYVAMAAFCYGMRKVLNKTNKKTVGIGIQIHAMHGPGAEDTILMALTRRRFANVNHVDEFYKELMRALERLARVPNVTGIGDLEETGAYKRRDLVLAQVQKQRRRHEVAMRALIQELLEANHAPVNPVLDKDSVTWYLQNRD